ncbi:MAG TPA: cytochrome b/b6 domain-containing protein [Candidatus Competibacteraceae bacterium]|nr:cytochrome b/b6 domain-containing protein [Candidatus Competibacteraceae bacterium]HQA27204.1 cytochrome b/b6 domain-containing protein [Candidatus Competibacteraceae bacterium]HQD55286.1 cytochrome b/b6 domain-containing protein [Candidatus Competibacteraceae bacterium]
MTEHDTTEIIVWDPLVRLFHWILVAAFTLAYFSQEGPFEDWLEQLDGAWLQTTHVWAGYTIAGLLLFRLIWGFVGPRHARFSDFVQGPRQTWSYLKEVLTLRAPRYLGHNPAGGAMIVVLLSSLTITVTAGLLLYGADKGAGPLSGLMMGASDAAIHSIKEVHEFFANLTLILVVGHLIGVIWESLLHRENLAHAMITGRKRA